MELRFKFTGTTIAASLSSHFVFWIVVNNWKHLNHTIDGDDNDYIDDDNDEREKNIFLCIKNNTFLISYCTFVNFLPYVLISKMILVVHLNYISLDVYSISSCDYIIIVT